MTPRKPEPSPGFYLAFFGVMLAFCVAMEWVCGR